MQNQIYDEAAAIQAATAAGFKSVEEYVNQTIKQAADVESIKVGIEEVRTGRVTSLADFDKAFRKEMGFAKPTGTCD